MPNYALRNNAQKDNNSSTNVKVYEKGSGEVD